MRKILSVSCITVSVIICTFLDYIAYRVSQYSTDSKLAMLIFIPSFIVILWLGTFYDQLSVKDGRAIFRKRARITLRTVYTVSLLMVCVIWLWVIYEYTYFFGNIIGSIKELFGK